MQTDDLKVLLPLLLLASTAVVTMLAISVARSHPLALFLTLAGLAATFGSLFLVAPIAPRQVTPLLRIDRYALFYFGLIAAASFAVALLAHGDLERQAGRREEFYVLLLIATLGASVLAASSHFASFFLGLETLSVPLFALTAYAQDRKRPLEAGMKYLVLAAASGAFLLFGMALVYADLGTMSFGRIGSLLNGPQAVHPPLLLAGGALILTGIGFKLSLVPFHLWTPDVYEGAPAPVTAFIATVSKGAVFALLLRLGSGAPRAGAMILALSLLAAASMIAGNLLALLQTDVKRILAYSSIAQMGYLLVAFLASGRLAVEAATFYLFAYFVTTLGAFGAVTLLSDPSRESDSLSDYRGLFRRRPLLAGIFTAMLLSLAGLPLTAGFVGKFYAAAAGAAAGRWTLVLILAVTSGISLFYYLRIIVALFARGEGPAGGRRSPSLLGTGLMIFLAGLLIWLGLYPTPFIRIVQAAAAGLG